MTPSNYSKRGCAVCKLQLWRDLALQSPTRKQFDFYNQRTLEAERFIANSRFNRLHICDDAHRAQAQDIRKRLSVIRKEVIELHKQKTISALESLVQAQVAVHAEATKKGFDHPDTLVLQAHRNHYIILYSQRKRRLNEARARNPLSSTRRKEKK